MRTSIVSPALLVLAACQSLGKPGSAPQPAGPAQPAALAAPAGAAELHMEIVTLKHGVARELAETFWKLFASAGVREGEPLVVFDDRTNSLILRGARKDLDRLKALVAALDVPVEDTSLSTKVVAVKHHNPSEFQRTLESVIAGHSRRHRPIVVADMATSRLILRGTRADLDQLERLIAELDVPVEAGG